MATYKRLMKEISGAITAPAGFKASGIHCGIKKRRKDLALIYSEKETVAQAVFTTNKIQSASVKLSRENLQDAKARAIVINSGCANACTGVRGDEDARVITALGSMPFTTGTTARLQAIKNDLATIKRI